MEIKRTQELAHKIAVSRGQWRWLAQGVSAPVLSRDALLAKLALIGIELARGYESARDGDIYESQTQGGESVGLPADLARVVCGVADLAGAMGIDLDAAVRAELGAQL